MRSSFLGRRLGDQPCCGIGRPRRTTGIGRCGSSPGDPAAEKGAHRVNTGARMREHRSAHGGDGRCSAGQAMRGHRPRCGREKEEQRVCLFVSPQHAPGFWPRCPTLRRGPPLGCRRTSAGASFGVGRAPCRECGRSTWISIKYSTARCPDQPDTVGVIAQNTWCMVQA